MQLTDEHKEHVRSLLVKRRKIDAIKYLRSRFKLKLTEAKSLIDLMDKEIPEHEYEVSESSSKNSVVIFAAIFAIIALGVAYYYDLFI
ncbi:hypothetical protein LVD15_07920 [Fulvivirga maritima]|uniref:hypothetical protein n=1 Tax=Fulvivirga maritima TaxID=2904247 RepID=UPI001F3A576B|nr:hypothetical protein [Fulvivirga maritima]UII28345.1 hypothetical protein LVD15_07920 [Fulvivirga maritima]